MPATTSPRAIPSAVTTPAVSLRPRLVARRYHFHWPGLAYAGTSVVLVIGAINGQNNLLFAIFGMAVGGLIVSGFLSGINLLGITVERVAVIAAGVGEEVIIRYRVRNTSRFFALMGITIEERSGGPFWKPARAGPGGLTLTGAAVVAHLSPGSETIVEARLRAIRRGGAPLDDIIISSTFPFGVTRKSVVISHPGEVLVWPRIDRAGLKPRNAADAPSSEDALSRPRPGQGPEFWSLRDYVPGDDPRSVAWKASARFDRVLVRETAFIEEHDCIVHVRTSAAPGDAVETALSRAASQAVHLLRHGAPVTLAIDERVIAARGTGPRQIDRVLMSLARWSPDAAPPAQTSPPAMPRRARVFEVIAGDAPTLQPPGAAA